MYKDFLAFINEYQTYFIIGATVLFIAIVFFLLRFYYGRNMRRKVYLCVEYFIRKCHELKFYEPAQKGYLDYLDLFKLLSRRKKFWLYSDRNKKFLNEFLEWFEMVDTFKSRISDYMDSGHYFAHSEFLDCLNVDIPNKTFYFISGEEFINYVHKKVPEAYEYKNIYNIEINKDFSHLPQEHNEIFVNEELERCRSFFDTVLRYPLDPQQRESIVKLEDNCLVISSAGSGKTSTSVGKIKYLVEKRNIHPSRILPLTYTVKAAGELTERLNLKEKGLKCYTFHGLAREIIISVTKKKPTLCEPGLMLQCFYYLVDNDESFKKNINEYLISVNSLTKNLHDYEDPEEYFKDRSIYGVQAPFKDMDGRIIFTRSEEEKKICTFLSLNGVAFRYEQPYFVDTTTQHRRQYYPDFTIYPDPNNTDYFVILEHFGVDKNDNVPSWFGIGHESENNLSAYDAANLEYHDGMKWKREVNAENHITLLETTSAMFHDGSLYLNLARHLANCGVRFNPLTEDEKFDKLVRRNQIMEDSILQLISTFITLMKSNRKTFDEILDTIKKENPGRKDFINRSQFMIDNIFKPMFQEYQKSLKEKRQMDYTDLIIKATDYCNEGKFKKEYDMILVDEFQDISVDRFQMIQSLRMKSPLTKLYAVGDDWQSIFRFSGSDLTLFNSFEEFFGYTERCKIEKTYRFCNPLVELSTEFILKNHFQVSKEVIPSDRLGTTNISLLWYTQDENDQLQLLVNILGGIDPNEDVMLLARYHNDANFIPDNNVVERNEKGQVTKVIINGRVMRFNTVHSAKGLEADIIILVNCSQDGNGFPSKVTDDPILGYLLSKPEDYPFPEERRLFYVAITRAKKHTYIMYKDSCPSPFVSEILFRQNPKGDDPTMECPWCGNGVLRRISSGQNRNGTCWRLYRCTNNTAGCDYKWLVSFRPENENSIPRQFDAMVWKSRSRIAEPEPSDLSWLYGDFPF